MRLSEGREIAHVLCGHALAHKLPATPIRHRPLAGIGLAYAPSFKLATNSYAEGLSLRQLHSPLASTSGLPPHNPVSGMNGHLPSETVDIAVRPRD